MGRWMGDGMGYVYSVLNVTSFYISLPLPPYFMHPPAPSAPPENFMGTAGNSTSVTVSWGEPPADEINGVIISYIINVTVVGTGQVFQLTSTTTSLEVTNLSPYTTFVCIIAAVTSAGTGPFNEQLTISTPQDGT